MTHQQAKTLRHKIEQYALSMVADSWKGSVEDPEDYESLVQDLDAAKNKMEKYLKSLIC